MQGSSLYIRGSGRNIRIRAIDFRNLITPIPHPSTARRHGLLGLGAAALHYSKYRAKARSANKSGGWSRLGTLLATRRSFIIKSVCAQSFSSCVSFHSLPTAIFWARRFMERQVWRESGPGMPTEIMSSLPDSHRWNSRPTGL